MASLRALQAYGEPILLQLVEGPQPQHAIEAPGFALEALREVGLVKRRMIRAGHVAEAYWYLWDDEGPAPTPPLIRCDDPDLFAGIPEN